jgi:transcriptional regulator with XRE-family HTH domain
VRLCGARPDHRRTPRARKRPAHANRLLHKLRERRIAIGLTLDALAKKAGFAEGQHISDWEFGRTQPIAGNLEAWVEALGGRLEAVFEDEP